MPKRSAFATLFFCDAILVVGLLGLTFLLGCFRQVDMDIWWHLKAGQMILQDGKIPEKDRFTFTSSDRDWIDLHWLFQIGAASLYRRGGMPLLTLCSASLATLTMAVALAGQRGGWSVPLSVACWLPALFLMSGRFYVRPEIVTLVCLGCFLTVLFHAPRHPRLLWLLAPVQLLWVNVQGLFVLGPILLLLFLADQTARRVWLGPEARLGRCAIACVGIAAVCLLNPYGFRGVWFPVELFRKMSGEAPFYGQVIGELESIGMFIERVGVRQLYLLIHFGLLGLASLSFVFAWSRGRFDLFRLLAFGVFAWLSLRATRNSGQFALVAGAVTAWNFGDWGTLRAAKGGLGRALGCRAAVAALLVLSLWGVGSGQFYAVAGEGRLVGLKEQPLWHAHEAAEFAAQGGMPQRMLAYHLGQAALFEFYKRDDQRVFCDPRLEVVSRQALEEYLKLEEAIHLNQPNWPQRLRAHQVSMILADHRLHFESEAVLVTDANWRCVYFDPVAGVFLHRRMTAQAGAPPVNWAARHFDAAGQLGWQPPAGGRGRIPPEPLPELAEATALVNIARHVQNQIGGHELLGRSMLLLAADRSREALEQYPSLPEAWRLLGLAAFHLGAQDAARVTDTTLSWQPVTMFDVARARYYLRQACELTQEDFLALTYLYLVSNWQGDRGAELQAARRLRALGGRNAAQREFLEQFAEAMDKLEEELEGYDQPERDAPTANLEELRTVTEAAIADGLLEQAAAQFEAVARREGKLPWMLADRYASLLLRIGEPARARDIWQNQLAGDWDEPRWLERIASTYLIEGDYRPAIETHRAALRSEPGQVEAMWGLARALLEVGDAQATIRECRRALQRADMPEATRNAFEWMLELAERD